MNWTLSSAILPSRNLRRWIAFCLAQALCLCLPVSVSAEYAEGMDHYRKAWVAYRTHRYDDAQRWVRRALQADPQNGHAQALLGEIAYLRHDLADAKRAWEKALALNAQLAGPLSGQIAQAEMEIAMESQLREKGSDLDARINPGALLLRVPKDLSAEQEQAILVTLTQAVSGLEPYFQYRVNRPLTVLIYPREAFYGKNEIASSAAPPRNDGVGLHMPTEVLGLFDGKIRVPENPVASRLSPAAGSSPATSSQQPATVLWHEYAHAVVHDLTNGWAPRWLHEGLAQEAEAVASRLSRVAGESTRSPQQATGNELPPLRAVLGVSERPGEPVVMPAGQFYAASHSLVRYLLESRGWDRMRRFLAVLGQGASVEEALRKAYGLDLLTLEKKWGEWYYSR